MGAILSQRGEDNRLHPVAYMSKSFSGAEANYDTHDKELLAIIKALEEWQYWMQARTFNQRHARWRGNPIIQFLTEDADNAPPSIRKAYRDYDWEEDLLWYRGKLVVPDSEPLKERLLRESTTPLWQDTPGNNGPLNY
ncbi:Retrotransposable element Tf2 protein [Rhizoctonia solani]|uniref:Retrotransposable element Tf2 protein n=1 Tax=Rhizoctonia solani TaxID=456999 RepID=A0A8H8P0H6_9AGAM|nr:Retrotransposable element Tf2 protein [Rhizoctonia solani]QRW22945.1 Retrotransposable element Tf2 protein [Rhizoctonia solani]